MCNTEACKLFQKPTDRIEFIPSYVPIIHSTLCSFIISVASLQDEQFDILHLIGWLHLVHICSNVGANVFFALRKPSIYIQETYFYYLSVFLPKQQERQEHKPKMQKVY